jgi:hypothetical protein
VRGGELDVGGLNVGKVRQQTHSRIVHCPQT